MTDLPQELRQQLTKLAQTSNFVENIEEYVNIAVSVLSTESIAELDAEVCPTALLLAFTHCLSLSLPFSSLAQFFSPQTRNIYIKACEPYDNEEMHKFRQFQQANCQQLCGVEWQMQIRNGKQVWKVEIKFESGRCFNLELGYEQLSVFVFKLNQALTYIQKQCQSK